ncbi:MAG: stage II sporulation protein M [Thiothrix sp.]|uniref:stage II sporulation protein M n=1 Tax=Thiothrix sp. TaxID=1032 RepID=UPI00260FF98C|nr:stage II sporulation protein M [Thiothrix sp.]MDD5392979.1 stage II sporulation protein M [Thiothrix sp.]
MKQEQFIQQYQPQWDAFEAWLDYQQVPKKERERQDLQEPALDFPRTYRQLCHHLALAQSRMYSPLLIQQLNQLVVRGHNCLYTSRLHFLHHIAEFYLRGLPQLVRQSSKALLLSAALFFGSFFVMLVAVQVEPELVYSVISGEQVAGMEEMYDPQRTTRFGREREADSDVFMFGFYIRNNTGIGFQVFAGGLLYGLGSLFFLLFNGLSIGAVAGHLTHVGYIDSFWGFVAGHSAFELTAIVLSGTAGFKLAEALIMPGRKSRLLALRDNSQDAIQIVYGSATLFIMAAFVEAFWSSQIWIPIVIKYTVGISLWLLVISYFTFAGRGQRDEA